MNVRLAMNIGFAKSPTKDDIVLFLQEKHSILGRSLAIGADFTCVLAS